MKPHIIFNRNYWIIYKSRTKREIIGLCSSFKQLSKVGPRRPAEINCTWYGDAKPS